MSNSTTTLVTLLSQLAFQSPWLLACLTGTIYFLLRRSTLGKPASWAASGFGLLFFASLAGALGTALIQQTMMSSAMPATDASILFAVLGGVRGLVEATGLLLLAVAVVQGRPRPAPEFAP